MWLRSNGFTRHCMKFLLEDVDGPALLEMTDTGLLMMGISDKTLLGCIHELRDQTTKPSFPLGDEQINMMLKELKKTVDWLLARIDPDHKDAPNAIPDLLKRSTRRSSMQLAGGPVQMAALMHGSKLSPMTMEPKKEDTQFFKELLGTKQKNSLYGPNKHNKSEIHTLLELTKRAAARASTLRVKINPLRQEVSNKEIADQSRFDVKLKMLRRDSRIILPLDLRIDEEEEDVADGDTAVATIQATKYIILPTNKYRGRFDLFMMVLIIYFSVTTPLNLGFELGLDNNIYLEIIFDALFFIDIVSNFFTAFTIEKGPNKGKLELRHKVIAKNYMRRWFWIDLVSTVPIDMIVAQFTHNSGGAEAGAAQFNKLIRLMRTFKLMRVLKMSRIFKRIAKKIKISPPALRLVKILLVLTFSWHCIGCFYFMIVQMEDDPTSAWNPPAMVHTQSLLDRYLHGYFWAVNSTLQVGTNIMPDTAVECFYTMFAIFFGLMANAFIVGSAKTAIDQLDMAGQVHREDLEAMIVYLNHYECPKPLQKKIMMYFQYLQSRYLDYASQDMFDNLHSALREDLVLELNQKLIKQVPMFRDISRTCLLAVIGKLEARVYMPQERIVVKGEKGLQMFFIVTGLVEKRKDKQSLSVHLRDGDFFCEHNLMTSERVDSNFKALSFTEICVLERNSFKRLLQQFPSFALTMQRYMKENMGKQKWQKIEHVIRITRLMNKLGGRVPFAEAYAAYNKGTTPGKEDVAVAKELLGDEFEKAVNRKKQKQMSILTAKTSKKSADKKKTTEKEKSADKKKMTEKEKSADKKKSTEKEKTPDKKKSAD